MTAPRIADALTVRAEYLRFGPFTQSELHGVGGTFVADVLDGRSASRCSPSPSPGEGALARAADREAVRTLTPSERVAFGVGG